MPDRGTAVAGPAVAARYVEHGIAVAVAGEVDLATVPIIEAELEKALQTHDPVTIDLTETTFMDSSGLHMIIAADKRLRARGARLMIVGVPPQVLRLFQLTGINDRLDVVPAISDPHCSDAT